MPAQIKVDRQHQTVGSVSIDEIEVLFLVRLEDLIRIPSSQSISYFEMKIRKQKMGLFSISYSETYAL